MHTDKRFMSLIILFISLSLSALSVIASASPEGLVAYWGFNETSGTVVYDSSGNGNHGAIYGATRVSGKSGNALQFDGASDYVSIPMIIPSPIEGTIEAWVKPENASGRGELIVYMGPNSSTADGWGDEEEMHLDIDDNIFEFYFGSMRTNNNSWYPDPPQHAPGVWYFVAATYKNGDYARLYVNGALVGAFEEDKNISTTTWSLPTLIGRPRADTRYFNGTLDEIRIYNRSLTQDEILADMGGAGSNDTQAMHDVSLSGMSVPGTATAGASVPVSAALLNKGSSAEENVPVVFSVDGTPLQTQYFNLSPGESKTVNFNWTAIAGNHNMALFANLSGDEHSGDNTVTGAINVAAPGSGGPASSGGGYYYSSSSAPPAPNNGNAYFSNISIPDKIKHGEELTATGCISSLGANSSVRAYVDGILSDSESVHPPASCFSLSAGTPPSGSRIITISLNGSSLAFNKIVNVWEAPKLSMNIVGISAPDSVFAGTPVKVLVFVQANVPQNTTVELSSDRESIGNNTEVASGKSAFLFIYTFSAPGNKTLEAVASTGTITDMASRKIEVKGRTVVAGSPTGMLISTGGVRAVLLIAAGIIALFGARRLIKGKKAPADEI